MRALIIAVAACAVLCPALPAGATSFGTANVTIDFGAYGPTLLYPTSGGGTMSYYAPDGLSYTWPPAYTSGVVSGSQMPASDGQGNVLTISGSDPRNQTVGFQATAVSALSLAFDLSSYGNKWILPTPDGSGDTFPGFSITYSFAGHTDTTEVTWFPDLIFANQLALSYNNGLMGDANQSVTCFTDFRPWSAAQYPYYLVTNSPGTFSSWGGNLVAPDSSGNFSASGSRTVSSTCSAALPLMNPSGFWEINVGFAAGGIDYHPDAAPEVPEPASVLLLGAGLAGLLAAARKRGAGK